MRRRPGLAGVRASAARREGLRALGAELNAESVAAMDKQLAAFTADLGRFASAHSAEIQDNPVFRAKFHDMCHSLGVDPLASRRGLWAAVLGDFYYVLGTRIVADCLATRPVDGGLVEIGELVKRIRGHQDKNMRTVGVGDVVRAVKSLRKLGSGFEVVDVGDVTFVRSVPLELSEDHTTVLNLCRNTGWVTLKAIVKEKGWAETRAKVAVDFLMEEELAWVDKGEEETMYWVLGLVPSY